MNTPSHERSAPRYETAVPELDATLAMLSAVHPREGLEQRVLATLAHAARVEPWYQRLLPGLPARTIALAAASVLAVAGAATLGLHQGVQHPAAPAAASATAKAPLHMARPMQQPVSTAAAVAVAEHGLQPGTVRTRHRGIHRAFRAQHDRIPPASGAASPLHPHAFSH